MSQGPRGVGAPAPDAADRVQERILLHEILRVGLARQEDLSLLQQIAQASTGLSPPAQTQAYKECQYREEWRCQRETQLLARLANMNLSSITDANMALLVQQVDKVKQMQMQQKQTRIDLVAQPKASAPSVQRSASLQPSLRGETSANVTAARSSEGAVPASSLGAALSLYAAPPRSPGPKAMPRTVMRDASRPSPGRTSPGGLTRSSSHKSSPVTLLTPQQLRAKLSFTQRDAEHANPSSNGVRVPPSDVLKGRASAPVEHAAGAAAPELPSTSQRPQRPATCDATTPARAVSRTMSVPSTPQRAHLPAPGHGGKGGDVPRFQRILKLQSTLLSGLYHHAESGGPQAAVAALEENVALMQLHFQECTAAARRLEAHNTQPDSHSSSNARLLQNWSRLLPLAQLGLTSQDVVRLHRIRQGIAARVIQRAARVFLRRVWHARALADAAVRAADATARLRDHAARVIQRYWRGLAARRRSVGLRAAYQVRHTQAIIARARRTCAATRIQRAWRLHRKRRKAQRAVAACSQSLPVFDSALPGDPTRERAAVVIQAAVRGWLWRRSNALWWRRSVRDLRDRRTGKRAWDNERLLLATIQPLQRQLLASVREEARERERVLSVLREEEDRFEAAWLRWLAAQHAQALQQPLPKGWVPHRDAATGTELFVDTKSGAMHAYHPAVLELRAFAAAERERAIAQLQQRTAAAARRLEALQAAGAAERAEITARITALVAAHATQAGGNAAANA